MYLRHSVMNVHFVLSSTKFQKETLKCWTPCITGHVVKKEISKRNAKMLDTLYYYVVKNIKSSFFAHPSAGPQFLNLSQKRHIWGQRLTDFAAKIFPIA